MTASVGTGASPSVWAASAPPPLTDGAVHVWRIRLDSPASEQDWTLLSPDEHEHARRFHFERDRRSFVSSHGMLRRLLGEYAGVPGAHLEFTTGAFGKPSMCGAPALEFNLSHSGDVALLAVSRDRAVGVDVERWNTGIDHVELAQHFFSAAECCALRDLAVTNERRTAGFFAAWSRKEAYLKAIGQGITRGLDHFDVSLVPDEPARLIADRLDAAATERWVMTSLAPAEGYSAALVAAAPVGAILLFDATSPSASHRR